MAQSRLGGCGMIGRSGQGVWGFDWGVQELTRESGTGVDGSTHDKVTWNLHLSVQAKRLLVLSHFSTSQTCSLCLEMLLE